MLDFIEQLKKVLFLVLELRVELDLQSGSNTQKFALSLLTKHSAVYNCWLLLCHVNLQNVLLLALLHKKTTRFTRFYAIVNLITIKSVSVYIPACIVCHCMYHMHTTSTKA